MQNKQSNDQIAGALQASVTNGFKREQVRTGGNNETVRSTCNRCGNSFVTNQRLEKLGDKEIAHTTWCDGIAEHRDHLHR